MQMLLHSSLAAPKVTDCAVNGSLGPSCSSFCIACQFQVFERETLNKKPIRLWGAQIFPFFLTCM